MTNPEVPNPTEDIWDDSMVYSPSTMITALGQIRVLIDQARQVPLSASIIPNKAETLDLLGQACEAPPDDLLQADLLVADADQVMERADSIAEFILAGASTRVELTLQGTDGKAEHIVVNVARQAERTAARTDGEAGAAL